jgi:hypothetical protein
MSRAYRVTWVTATSEVTTQDTLRMSLSLLGILSEAEMAALLRDELVRDGWQRQSDGTLTHDVKGLTATLSPDAAVVTVHDAASGQVQARGTSKDAASQALKQEEAAVESKLKAEVTKRLSSIEPDLRTKVGEAIQRVYVEALRKKAASMGTIESVHQQELSGGEYEVTIKVRT